MKPIVIEDYSAKWPSDFEMLRLVYATHLNGLVSDIQHVGSTSVPGLSAKPVIDIDLIIEDRKVLDGVIAKLEMLGYEYVGDLGIKDREAFRQKPLRSSDDGPKREWPAHNLYVCLAGSIALQNHLALRGYLRAHPEKAKQYGELKKQLVAVNPYDIDLYIKNKTPFITGILEEMGFGQNALAEIKMANGFI